MSQAKVDRYKEEKCKPQKDSCKRKRKRIAGTICGWLNCITYRRMGRILRL